MISFKRQAAQTPSLQASELLLEESFVKLKQDNELATQKLEYLMEMKKQSNEELKQLSREVMELKKKLRDCERKVDRSVRKNALIEASLVKIKQKVEEESVGSGIGQQNKEREGRQLDLGKFVRKNLKSRKTDSQRFPSEYVSADHSKPSQTQIMSKSPVTPRVMSKNLQPYFQPPKQPTRSKKSKNHNHQYLHNLKHELDTLIYKQLKSSNKEEKKVIRKEIKQRSRQIDDLQSERNKTKCKCGHRKKLPSDLMSF